MLCTLQLLAAIITIILLGGFIFFFPEEPTKLYTHCLPIIKYYKVHN